MGVTRPEFGSGFAVERAHDLLLFSSTEELVAVVMGHLREGLAEGGSALAIATEEHRRKLAAALGTPGFDAYVAGRLVFVDAEEALAQLLVEGHPSAERFSTIVGRLVGARRAPLHVYDEMVAVLWSDGRVSEAAELEGLWRELGERSLFRLLCGYPSEIMGPQQRGVELRAVGDLHGVVLGRSPLVDGVFDATTGESATIDAELRLATARSSVREARAFLRELLREATPADRDAAELIVSELVTNALQHGRGETHLRIRAGATSIMVLVSDEDSSEPVLRQLDTRTPGGRGLQIVEHLARRWGVARHGESGKVVWAELQREGDRPAGR